MEKNENVNKKSWLVPVDNSTNSEAALYFALDRMNKENDTLFLLTAVEEEAMRSYLYGTINSGEILATIQQQKEEAGRLLLQKMTRRAKQFGIKTIRLLLGKSNEAGDLICKAVDKHSIDYCCMGRRGMGKLKRLFVGSTSYYVAQYANCHVFVVKGEHGPIEKHDVSVSKIKSIEEVERIRRIKEHDEEERKEDDRLKMESLLSKNITIVAEEEERMRRIAEEKKHWTKRRKK